MSFPFKKQKEKTAVVFFQPLDAVKSVEDGIVVTGNGIASYYSTLSLRIRHLF